MVPTPPERLVPPTMAAVIASNSYPSPAFGCPDPSLLASNIPAKDAINALNEYTDNFTFVILTPLNRAASSFPPTAYICFAHIVFFIKKRKLIKTIHNTTTGIGIKPARVPFPKNKKFSLSLKIGIPSTNSNAKPRIIIYDAIGLSFPDVVVKDSIVGGEVFKTRGIRENPSINYEEEFRLITHLNKELRQFVIQDGVIGIVNDGPMAAFTAAAETAYEDIDSVNKGVLAYTLGTELGTGYLDAQGKIPNIPLEVYNFIIDLGSWPEKIFPSDDVRSINNFNTELAGTLQKYTSQSGAFRLAVKYFPKENPTLYNSLFEKNFLTEHHSAAGDSKGLYLVVEPKDMRKPFLEYLMSLAAQGTETNAQRIFTEIGEYLAVAFAETKRILEPTADTAILFGRLVKQKKCFELLHSGSKDLVGENAFMPANEEMALTPLMKQLKDNKYYTVAQFAQAIGAIHYASYRKNILA